LKKPATQVTGKHIFARLLCSMKIHTTWVVKVMEVIRELT